MNQQEQDQFEQILKILEDERIGDINRSRAQATAVIEWMENKKADMRETIFKALVKERSLLYLDTEEPECANSLRDCRIYADAICAALVPIPPLQIPPFTDDDADRAFREEDKRDREITRLTKELEEKVTPCCKRDHDHDGNCDQHPVGWTQKLQEEVERLSKELEDANSYIESAKRENAHATAKEIWEKALTALCENEKLKAKILFPGDKRWIFVNNKIRQVIVEEINTKATADRVIVSVNCRGSTICFDGLKPEELFLTEADCRASIETVGLE